VRSLHKRSGDLKVSTVTVSPWFTRPLAHSGHARTPRTEKPTIKPRPGASGRRVPWRVGWSRAARDRFTVYDMVKADVLAAALTRHFTA
jgi:hypothetical protein